MKRLFSRKLCDTLFSSKFEGLNMHLFLQKKENEKSKICFVSKRLSLVLNHFVPINVCDDDPNDLLKFKFKKCLLLL